jgi:hypothetical protein
MPLYKGRDVQLSVYEILGRKEHELLQVRNDFEQVTGRMLAMFQQLADGQVKPEQLVVDMRGRSVTVKELRPANQG